jgi:hypothetical protein
MLLCLQRPISIGLHTDYGRPGTQRPISFDDRNTRDVFGPYIDVYDITAP